ncbi:LOW QUALITY PROTEIN: hypothetical protein HID58_065027, partial [Brassica napus]
SRRATVNRRKARSNCRKKRRDLLSEAELKRRRFADDQVRARESIAIDTLKSQARIMETIEQSIIPGLPDDLALKCIAKLSHGYHGKLECFEVMLTRAIKLEMDGQGAGCLPILTTNGLLMTLMLIGGIHCLGTELFRMAEIIMVLHHVVVTNVVMRFDPFKKEWKMVASMRTPRTRFACAAVSGKVYVAGGCNLTQSSGVSSAEVYDPVADRWEDLLEIPRPEMNCSWFGYRSFHELRAGEQISTQAFNPLEMSWSTVVDIWPLPRRMNYAVQVLGHGFAALRDELYVIGGRFLKLEKSGSGGFERLSVVRLGLWSGERPNLCAFQPMGLSLGVYPWKNHLHLNQSLSSLHFD